MGAFFVSTAVYSGYDVSASLADPDLFLPLLGASLYLALVAVFSLGVGTMVRSSAGGIGIVLALLLVVPTVLAAGPRGLGPGHASRTCSPRAGTNMFAPTELTGTEIPHGVAGPARRARLGRRVAQPAPPCSS